MPLTQQPSFEAVKTLYVRPSTRAGNSKTTSYIPRRVLYTEPEARWQAWPGRVGDTPGSLAGTSVRVVGERDGLYFLGVICT